MIFSARDLLTEFERLCTSPSADCSKDGSRQLEGFPQNLLLSIGRWLSTAVMHLVSMQNPKEAILRLRAQLGDMQVSK